VPESWESHTISEIGNVITGSTPSTKIVEYYNGEYNLISPADLGDEKYVTTSHKTMTRLGFEQCRKLPKDSVLVGCIGNIGKIGLVNNENCASNQQINAIVCNSSFNSHFVFYLLLFHQKVLESKASKVTIPILNKSNFESIVFYFPPYEIQNDIARILSSVDIKISHFKKKKQILTDLFKTLLHELITGQRRVHNISFVSL
jgi:type I restriction enzyme S subunit